MGRGERDPRPKIWGLIELHDLHPGAFEASLIRAGLRWRNVGTPDFTWGDCVAVVEHLDWDDPLARARNPNDWVWGDPLRDPVVSVIDVLAQMNAKTPRPKGMPASRLPKRIERPSARSASSKPQIHGEAKPMDEMDTWMQSRIAKT